VQRSSETIGTIAAAQAKAQAQLVNPAKSLVGTIPSEGRRGTEQTFRYAPLSSGLDIVRKALSQHEIAPVQTTSIDDSAGIVRLSTVLAHASGEWIASDWPVCAIGETAAPHRMGAALTYARRYALFTLVGIAGEDDVDAPDLLSPLAPETKPDGPTGHKNERFNGGQGHAKVQQASAPHRAKSSATSSRPTFEPEASAPLREQLTAELKDISSADEAAHWAHRVMGAKNRLTVSDAEHVERAFQERMLSITNWAAAPAIPNALHGHCTVQVAKTGAADLRSTKLYWRRRRRVAFAIGSTLNPSPSSRVWSGPPMLTICALPSRRRLAGKSATSLRFRCAGDITVRCIAAGMNPSGGT
jgi:hypothetical protein